MRIAEQQNRPWRIPPPPVDEADILERVTADVVVVGAGHAGIAAALSAFEGGASVVLLEKSPKKNMNIFGNEIGTFNSQFAKGRGVPVYDPVDLIAEFQRRTLNRCNTDLIRQFANCSGETFDWFLSHLDPSYGKHMHIHMQRPPKYFEGELNGYKNFIGTMVFNRATGNSLIQAVRDILEKMEAAGVTVRYGMPGEQLVTENGRVAGVLCRGDEDGKYRRFDAKRGVVLAAGDYGGNREMVLDLNDEFAELSGDLERYNAPLFGRDGSGIRMGLFAGGMLEPGPRGGLYCSITGHGGPLGGAHFLRLNEHGKRFTNEGFMGFWGFGVRAVRQPHGRISVLWDSNWREELEYQGLDHVAVDPSNTEQLDNMRKNFDEAARVKTGVRFSNHTEVKTERPVNSNEMLNDDAGYMDFVQIIYAGDTIEELAKNMGFSGAYYDNFVASVYRYNALAEKGRDEDFAKDPRQLHALKYPPYFGFKAKRNVGTMNVTCAGLMVDEHQRVLDGEYEPIPGLFATGNCAGELFPIQYTTPMGGASIGICQTLGRRVGLYLAGL